MKEDIDTWAAPGGAAVVVTLLLCIGLVAAGGWKWFADFLTSSASGWAQAFGAVIAVIAAARIAGADQRRREEHALVVAEFTASKLTGRLDPFSLQTGGAAEQFSYYSKADVDPKKFPSLLENLKEMAIELTEDQLMKLAPVPKGITHDLIDSVVVYENAVKLLEATVKDKTLLQDGAFRKERARTLAEYLLKSHRLATSSRAALLAFLKDRGVTIHNIVD